MPNLRSHVLDSASRNSSLNHDSQSARFWGSSSRPATLHIDSDSSDDSDDTIGTSSRAISLPPTASSQPGRCITYRTRSKSKPRNPSRTSHCGRKRRRQAAEEAADTRSTKEAKRRPVRGSATGALHRSASSQVETIRIHQQLRAESVPATCPTTKSVPGNRANATPGQRSQSLLENPAALHRDTTSPESTTVADEPPTADVFGKSHSTSARNRRADSDTNSVVFDSLALDTIVAQTRPASPAQFSAIQAPRITRKDSTAFCRHELIHSIGSTNPTPTQTSIPGLSTPQPTIRIEGPVSPRVIENVSPHITRAPHSSEHHGSRMATDSSSRPVVGNAACGATSAVQPTTMIGDVAHHSQPTDEDAQPAAFHAVCVSPTAYGSETCQRHDRFSPAASKRTSAREIPSAAQLMPPPPLPPHVRRAGGAAPPASGTSSMNVHQGEHPRRATSTVPTRRQAEARSRSLQAAASAPLASWTAERNVGNLDHWSHGSNRSAFRSDERSMSGSFSISTYCATPARSRISQGGATDFNTQKCCYEPRSFPPMDFARTRSSAIGAQQVSKTRASLNSLWPSSRPALFDFQDLDCARCSDTFSDLWRALYTQCGEWLAADDAFPGFDDECIWAVYPDSPKEVVDKLKRVSYTDLQEWHAHVSTLRRCIWLEIGRDAWQKLRHLMADLRKSKPTLFDMEPKLRSQLQLHANLPIPQGDSGLGISEADGTLLCELWYAFHLIAPLKDVRRLTPGRPEYVTQSLSCLASRNGIFWNTLQQCVRSEMMDFVDVCEAPKYRRFPRRSRYAFKLQE